MDFEMGSDLDRHSEEVSHLDRVFAVPMFLVALLFLIVAAAFLHLTQGDFTSWLSIYLLAGLATLYLFLIAETVVHKRAGSPQMKQHLWYLLNPFLRLCPRDHVDGERAWIAGLGWRKTTGHLETFLSRLFSGPMIIIALLVLPVVIIEFFYASYINANPSRRYAIDACSGFIWMAFVFEFVVMVSIVKKPLMYCRKNWIDLAIVLLPLVSFMGAARLGRLVKLKQLSRTAKIYRMRGLALRSWRAIVALDVLDRVLRRTPEDKMDNLQGQIEEKEHEIEELRQELERIRKLVEEKEVPKD
jgi:voltage-gated potassium channel